MPSSEKDAVELLRSAQAATDGDLRRAYLRAVVWTHRTGVFDIVDRLDALRRAYDRVRAPGATPGDLPSHEPVALEQGIRSATAREILRHSLRSGATARRENAETVRHIVAEHDRLELAAARARILRRRIEWAVRLILTALLIAGILWLSQRIRSW